MSDVVLDDGVPDEELLPDEVEARPIKGRFACPLEGCSLRGESAGGIKRHLTKVHKVNGRDYDVGPDPRVTYGATVYGPDDEKVRVLFYPSGKVRFRINEAGPMAIEEAFLTGEGKNVIIKLAPAS
jgi:hypothetical protein